LIYPIGLSKYFFPEPSTFAVIHIISIITLQGIYEIRGRTMEVAANP